MAEHDVEGEERRVREREGQAERLALEPDPGERVDAADREQERGGVAPASGRRARRARSRGGTRSRRPWPAAGGRSPGRSSSSSARARRRAGASCGRAAAPTAAARRRARPPRPRSAASAVPSGPTRTKSSTAKAGPEVVEDGADREVGVRWEAPHASVPCPCLLSTATVQIEGIMASRLSDQRLDATNLRLIEELQRDARQSLAGAGPRRRALRAGRRGAPRSGWRRPA